MNLIFSQTLFISSIYRYLPRTKILTDDNLSISVHFFPLFLLEKNIKELYIEFWFFVLFAIHIFRITTIQVQGTRKRRMTLKYQNVAEDTKTNDGI